MYMQEGSYGATPSGVPTGSATGIRRCSVSRTWCRCGRRSGSTPTTSCESLGAAAHGADVQHVLQRNLDGLVQIASKLEQDAH